MTGEEEAQAAYYRARDKLSRRTYIHETRKLISLSQDPRFTEDARVNHVNRYLKDLLTNF